MSSYEEAFRKLWALARRSGIVVTYEVDPDYAPGERNGSHEPAIRVPGFEDILAKIRLYREVSLLPQSTTEPDFSDVEADMCTLAHEMGHDCSAEAMTPEQRGDQHRAAKRHPPLRTERDKQLLIEEEERAWRYAADLLAKVGIDASQWSEFLRRKTAGLAAWRDRLARSI